MVPLSSLPPSQASRLDATAGRLPASAPSTRVKERGLATAPPDPRHQQLMPSWGLPGMKDGQCPKVAKDGSCEPSNSLLMDAA